MIAFFFILVGLIGLLWSGDRFVAGAAQLARHMGVSALLVGLTVVALGTSAPEIFVGVIAAFQGNSGLALGNVIGSNIANIGFVVAMTALIRPMVVHSRTVWREGSVLLLVTLFASVLLANGALSRVEGALLLLGLGVFLVWLVWVVKHTPKNDGMIEELRETAVPSMPVKWALFWVAVGLVGLPFSADLLVQGAVRIAHHFGVSDLVIGLTIVAVGTSLPEAATSVIAALKGEDDIAIGNIIGSNIFNLLAVLGAASLVRPMAVPNALLRRDVPVMFVLTIVMLMMAYSHKGEGRINRLEGGLLLLGFIGYIAWLVQTA